MTAYHHGYGTCLPYCLPVFPLQVYKKLGQTHLALMNFSWAMDLDPKGANNQIKEAIDKRYLPEDEGETASQEVVSDWFS